MANFDSTTRQKISAVHTASRLLQVIYSVYTQSKSAQALLQLYQANTDPAFNAAVNAMFTASERSELGTMLADINNLCTTWENSHAAAIAEG